MQTGKNSKIRNVLSYVLLVVLALVWLFPFFGIVMQSFRSYASEYGGMTDYLLPRHFSLDNYRFLFSGETNYLKWYGNTMILAMVTALAQTAIVLCVSYVFSRIRFRGRTFLMRFFLVLKLFPGFLTLICLYFLLKSVGLTENGAIPGLILVYTASSGMEYYICKGFMDTIPRSLDEAAMLEGATRLQVFSRVILPLARPAAIYTMLTAFMLPWGDFMMASYISFGNDATYNVAVAMQRWATVTDYQGYFTRFCAGGVLAAVPVTILFMILQRYYLEGVSGAVKG
ncbi:MAG: ABC transporter permease subunit [Eubacterium sp.]|nr:ABC transporter permease subunit [Eubacterium sp.]